VPLVSSKGTNFCGRIFIGVEVSFWTPVLGDDSSALVSLMIMVNGILKITFNSRSLKLINASWQTLLINGGTVLSGAKFEQLSF
jgi:hypothetical protein